MADEDLIQALNYLGREVSVPLQGGTGPTASPGSLPASPVGPGGQAPGAGPAEAAATQSPGEIQRAALEALTGGSRGGSAISGGGARVAEPGESNLGDILSAAGKAGKLVSEVFPGADISHAMEPETRKAFEAQRAGERGDITQGPFGKIPATDTSPPVYVEPGGATFPEGAEFQFRVPGVPLPFAGAEEFAGGMAFPEGAEFGFRSGSGIPVPSEGPIFDIAGDYMGLGGIGAALGAGLSAFNAANATNDFDKARSALHAALYGLGPATGGATALAAGASDTLSSLIEGFGGPSMAQFLGFAPSQAWLDFAPNLAENLGTTQTAITGLANRIASANTPEELQQAALEYRNSIDRFARGFSAPGAGPYDLPTPPGATGTEHEGGLTMDFGDVMSGVRDFMARRLAFLENPNAGSFAGQSQGAEALAKNLADFSSRYLRAPDPSAIAAAQGVDRATMQSLYPDLPADWYGQPAAPAAQPEVPWYALLDLQGGSSGGSA